MKEENPCFPFIHADCKRYQSISVEYKDEQGIDKMQKIEGFKAFAFQQAWDHTLGKHIIDWRINHGNFRLQQNIAQRLPKTN